MNAHQVIIAGGGIGGLGAALMLGRRGVQVTVLERAPEFAEVGAGIQLAPNVTRVLAEYGILDDLLPYAVTPRRLVAMNARTGEQLSTLDLADVRSRYGAPYIVLHRSDLLDVLLRHVLAEKNVTLLPGHEVVDVEDLGESVVVRTANGAELTGDLLLGADGLRSAVRGAIVQDDVVCSGYVAYRGAVPVGDVDARGAMDDVMVWMGPGLHLVQYPVRAGELYNQVAVFRSQEYLDGVEAWGSPEELDRTYAGMCEPVRRAIPSLQRNHRWPMFDRAPVDTWTRGRVSLLGDAAHPMLQYLAQGAGQALLDGATLAQVLPAVTAGPGLADGAALAGALAGYEGARVALAGRVQSTARTWGEIWHVDGLAATLRDEAFRQRDVTDYRHVDWLYGAPADHPGADAPATAPVPSVAHLAHA